MAAVASGWAPGRSFATISGPWAKSLKPKVAQGESLVGVDWGNQKSLPSPSASIWPETVFIIPLAWPLPLLAGPTPALRHFYKGLKPKP